MIPAHVQAVVLVIGGTLFGLGCATSFGGVPSAPLQPVQVDLPPGGVEVGDDVSADSAALIRRAAGPHAVDAALKRLIAAEQEITGRPLVAGNEVRLLIDGPETYAAMFAAIDGASDYVLMESFIVADDEVGQRLAERLRAAVRRGVDVRMLVDGIGSFSTSEEYFESLRRSGIDVRQYNPPDPAKNLRLWRLNHRNHRKLTVVDGHTAYLGGVNFAGVYERSSRTDPGPEAGMEQGWRDTHAEIRGPVVADFQRVFADNWAESGEPLPARLMRPSEAREAGPHLVRPLVSHGGDDEEFAIYRSYLAAVELSEQRVWLTHAYFAPNEEFLSAIEAAARRGVDVRLLLPGFIDFTIIYYATRANFTRLLDAGVRIYERNDALLHAKTAVVDGVWSTVGSANLDIRSFVHNDEVNAVVLGETFGDEMEAVFRADLQEAREIGLDAWRQRSFWQKSLEWLASRFNYWL